MIIWLASYPRSGNTFFRLLLSNCYGQDTYSIYNDRELERMGMAPALRQQKRPGLLEMREADRPYFLKTHERPTDESPTIYLIRDGRDAAVSLAHHLLAESPQPGVLTRAAWRILDTTQFERTLAGVIDGSSWPGPWHSHVDRWTRHGAAPARPTAIVRYEDLIADPLGQVRGALDRIGVPLCPSGDAPPSFEDLHARWPTFFREGRSGTWREEMNESLHRCFWQQNRDAMLRFGYSDGSTAPVECLASLPRVGRNAGSGTPATSIQIDRFSRQQEWGAALYQYMFLRSFSLAHALTPLAPEWAGQRLFSLPDAREPQIHPDARLHDGFSRPPDEWHAPLTPSVAGTTGPREARVNEYILSDPMLSASDALPSFRHGELVGSLLVHSRKLSPWRNHIRRILEVRSPWGELADEAVRQLRERGRTLVAVRLVFGRGRLDGAFPIPARWYRSWLERVWSRLDDPVLFVSSDQPQRALESLRAFRPLGAGDLAMAPADPTLDSNVLSFLDWLLLSRSDVMAIANEPSSFTAAMRNDDAAEFWRPCPRLRKLERFDPWDDEPIRTLPQRLTIPRQLSLRLRLIGDSQGTWRALRAAFGAPSLYLRLLADRARRSTRSERGEGALRELMSLGFYVLAPGSYSHRSARIGSAS